MCLCLWYVELISIPYPLVLYMHFYIVLCVPCVLAVSPLYAMLPSGQVISIFIFIFLFTFCVLLHMPAKRKEMVSSSFQLSLFQNACEFFAKRSQPHVHICGTNSDRSIERVLPRPLRSPHTYIPIHSFCRILCSGMMGYLRYVFLLFIYISLNRHTSRMHDAFCIDERPH